MNSPYNRFEPANEPLALGPVVRRKPLANEFSHIGPDTEGLAPGFHKQSNGMLMYVPNMADPIYQEPEGDDPEDAGEPIDLQCDVTRPVGFYDVRLGDSREYVRYWGGTTWVRTDTYSEDARPAEHWRYKLTKNETISSFGMLHVMRARPDLDAMVQK